MDANEISQVSAINMSASVYLQYCFLGITILSLEHKYTFLQGDRGDRGYL